MEKSNKTKAIVLIIICTLFATAAQPLYKIGISRLSLSNSIISLITENIAVIAGLFFYGLAAIFLIFALKYGELSMTMPLMATSYIWVFIISIVFLHEKLSAQKLSGTLSIVAGIYLIANSGYKAENKIKRR